MQGFVNLAADIGVVLATLIPLICYLMGGGLLIAALHGFWQVLKPGSESNRNPFLPWAALFTSATLLSYDRMLTFANNTFGGGVNTSLSGALTTYAPVTVDAATMMGATPEDTLLNIIAAFEYFFKAYGALVVLFGVLGLYHLAKGNRHHHHTLAKPMVQIVFGIAVMNTQTIAPAVMGYFA